MQLTHDTKHSNRKKEIGEQYSKMDCDKSINYLTTSRSTSHSLGLYYTFFMRLRECSKTWNKKEEITSGSGAA